MEPDHRPVSENIISLTLEIVFLLTGEDYKVVGKSSEFAAKGIFGVSSAKKPTILPTCRSVMVDKKILEVSNKIVHLLTGEVWRFLGHAAVHNDVVKESLQTIISPGSPEVSYNETPLTTIKQEPLVFEEEDLSYHREANGHLMDRTITPCPGQESDNSEEYTQSQSVSELKEEPQVFEEESNEDAYILPESVRLYKDVLPEFCKEEPHPHPEVCRHAGPTQYASYVEDEPIPYKEGHVPDGGGYTKPDTEGDSGEGSRSGHLEGDPSITIIEYNDKLYGSEDQKRPSSDIQECFAVNADLTKHHQHSLLNFDCGSCSAKNAMLIRNEKQISCPDCGKSFSAISHLIRHQRIHTGEKPFACGDCGRSFNQKATLIKHQRTHTGEKPFVCSDCGKCFTSSANLTQHQRVHTGEKPYTCTVCGKTFRSSPNLITHQRIHTGEKPYYCIICGKFFTNSSVLVRHQKTHTGEKPFSCNVCGKSFIQSCQLTKHKRVHTLH